MNARQILSSPFVWNLVTLQSAGCAAVAQLEEVRDIVLVVAHWCDIARSVDCPCLAESKGTILAARTYQLLQWARAVRLGQRAYTCK